MAAVPGKAEDCTVRSSRPSPGFPENPGSRSEPHLVFSCWLAAPQITATALQQQLSISVPYRS